MVVLKFLKSRERPVVIDGVRRETVRFNAGDSFIVGHLYRPMDGQRAAKHPAAVVGGSLTSVKEQMSGIYALALAKRGVMALAIDYRNYGASCGEPRQFEDPDQKVDDLVAAVTYLEQRKDVDAQRISLLGVCTSGGTVLYGAARDRRVRAVATVAGWFAEPDVAPLLYGGEEGVAERRAAGEAARAEYERSGENKIILAYHNEDQSASHVGPMEYYMDKTRGGGVAEWRNEFAVMSWGPWLDFNPVAEAQNVSAYALIIHSGGSALPDQARKVFDLLKGTKTLHWAEGDHFSFYDHHDKVADAADRVAEHFRRTR
ncbi:MAG: alpha/beta fold hydrolase [Pseudomonadota bacterium]